MKKLLFLLLLVYGSCPAQNWQCLQAGVKHYFINGNGYLRGIRIDSVQTSGSDIVYYPFHTPRGSYTDTTTYLMLDSNSGSWLGKKVIQQTDGTFIFDSYWNDSVIIKTQSHLGDSWVFYSDSGSVYYTASVTAVDTMTVLSALDSVKILTINAHNASGIVTSDSVNGFTIILSKNYGFAQSCDLYTFPYHKPDSAYRPGLDFYLDMSMCTPAAINNYPHGLTLSINRCLFRLTDFINPNQQQLHPWSVGDIIESENIIGVPMFGTINTKLYDTVVSKTVSGHYFIYTVSGTTLVCPYPYNFYPCAPICKSGVYTFSDEIYPILDTFHLPEESHYSGQNTFYYPYDTTYCSFGPSYTIIPVNYYHGLGWHYSIEKYTLGVGKTFFQYADGEPTYETDQLDYFNIGGIGCGTPFPVSVKNPEPSETISLHPNPATNSVTIESSSKITSITLSNALGQILYNNNYNSLTADLNLTNFPSGIYFVRINGTTVKKFVKE
jgi:hypothetical protein